MNIRTLNRSAACALMAAMVTLGTAAHGQAGILKNKPVRIVVPTPAGAAPDVVARILGDKFRLRFGQAAIIDNRTGAGGIIAVNAVKNALADGTNLLLAQASVAVVTPLTYKEARYDIEADFEPVSVLASTPMLFVANPATGPKTWADAIRQGKAEPEKVTVGNPFRTSVPHLAAELVGQQTGARFMNIPMTTTGQGIQAVVAGDTMMYVDGVAPLVPLVKEGRLRALAVTSSTELPGLEGIPLASSQVPGLDVSGWFVLFAPKGTPKEVIAELNRAADEAMHAPDAVATMRNLGTYPIGGSVADAVAFVKKEKKLWADVIQTSGLKAE